MMKPLKTENQVLPRVNTEQSRERSFSTIDRLKIFDANQTPPLLKNYNSSKNNNDSSALNSQSTNTTTSSSRPKMDKPIN